MNVLNAMRAGIALIHEGFAPLVPHLTHFMDPEDSLGHEVWLEVDLPWVLAAEAVLRLPGKSDGADRETSWATQYGVPVFHTVDQIVRHFRGH